MTASVVEPPAAAPSASSTKSSAESSGSTSLPPRNRGLDTLRATAIVLVFMYHYMVFVSREPTFGWLSVIGWVGVDLFFVLSGYLIANQVLRGWMRNEPLHVGEFYARRALRTWPAFWVVLAAYFLLPDLLGGNTPPPLWRFLTFTQNILLTPGTAFSHAWSLCIEEQFYLVLPLVLIAARRIGTRRAQAWLLLGGLMLAATTVRAVLWTHYGREDFGEIARYYPSVYYSTWSRFDEFLPGVAVALLKHAHPKLWARLMQRGKALLAVGLIATVAMLYVAFHYNYINGYGWGFFMSAFGYSLIAIAFAVLVMAALSPTSPLHGLHVPGAYSLALWSYSIYLTHKAVGHVLAQQAKTGGWSPGVLLVLVTITSLLAGWLLFKSVEAPFLKFRERWVPAGRKAAV